ncbi:MAG TPA: cytochrome P450 [Frankiaceae bacterium]|nr:cytochrome P450 [Frankiaceae bacterium]
MSAKRVDFDPHDPRFAEAGVPFEALARIRRDEPVYRTPSGSWYLSRFADVEAALQDVDTFRAELGPITGIPAGVVSIPEDQHFLSEIPEPRHGKIRRLYNSVLGAHRVKDIDAVIEAECHRLVDVMLQSDVADLHGQYAAAIPAFTMAHFIGVGAEAAPLFMQWSMDGTLMTRPATPGVGPHGPATHPYFEALLAEQRALPEPSIRLIRVFLEAEIDGRPLTDREIVTQLHFMLQAGVHTTRGFLTHLMNRLVQDPDLLVALRADDGAIAQYLEESLRHDAPVLRTTRLCTRDAAIGDVAISAGEWVEMGIASANRDDVVYEDGRAFSLTRPDARRHLAFGAGSHVCPGAALARREGELAVRVLLERVSQVLPVDGAAYPPLPGSLGHAPVLARLVP